jgi:FixJ family two-component response regulator
MARLLAVYGFQARCYLSAREFLESLQDGAPDCLIVDFRMNGMTGLELLHHLAGTEFRIPAIVITADEEHGLRHRCELAGASAFLTKPVTGHALLNAITAAIGAASPALSLLPD